MNSSDPAATGPAPLPTGAAAPPTSLSVPLLAEGLAGIEPFLAPWGERCGLLPRDLSRLGYAVSEVAEAAALLATTLGIPGSLELTLHPFSRWLTVEISYPKGIPLDPIFDPDDPSLVELPGLRLAPDIFWRRIVVEWIDRAGWKGGAFRSSISLTQFAREVERFAG